MKLEGVKFREISVLKLERSEGAIAALTKGIHGIGDGAIVNGLRQDGVPVDIDYFPARLELPCGQTFAMETIRDLPLLDYECQCGLLPDVEHHYFVKWYDPIS